MKEGVQNILITIYNFDGFHGSILYALEVGEYLASQGNNVALCSTNIKQPMVELAKRKNIQVHHLNTLPLDTHYDIIWTHHFPILSILLHRGIQFSRIIHGVLGSVPLLETPLFCAKDVTFFYTVSKCLTEIVSERTGIPMNKINTVPNFLPDPFHSHTASPNKILQKVAVVSNHTPQEIKNLAQHLNVDYYGIDFGKSVEITPELISQYDVIITIGKTVQYAMGVGVPVYEYDHFGGIGYITPQNIDAEEYDNFSGRSTCRKISTDEIHKELVEGYSCALHNAPQLKELARQRYLLSTKVDEIITQALNQPVCKINLQSQEYYIFGKYAEYIETLQTRIKMKVSKYIVLKLLVSLIPIAKYRRKARKLIQTL